MHLKVSVTLSGGWLVLLLNLKLNYMLVIQLFSRDTEMQKAKITSSQFYINMHVLKLSDISAPSEHLTYIYIVFKIIFNATI